MSSIDLIGVEKVYDNGFRAVKGVTLHVRDREFMVLVGPSGCGKTTCLRSIAGLEEVTSGDIRIGDRVVTRIPPKDRDIAMVFQNYALYPHMTVGENMSFGLRLRGVPREQVSRIVAETANLLGLVDQLQKRPRQLSGGQRQRVALGRAIVRQPRAFLFDEPLSNLDAKLRTDMRYELKTLQQRLATTTVYVTHDQVEAMTLGDRITVMSQGEIQQVGTPREVYDAPANRFVAAFIGTPAMNFIPGTVVAQDGAARFRSTGGLDLPLSHRVASLPASVGEWSLGVRPEHLMPAATGQPAVAMRVTLVESMGDHQCVYLQPEGSGQRLVMTAGADAAIAAGQTIPVGITSTRAHLFAGVDDLSARVPFVAGT